MNSDYLPIRVLVVLCLISPAFFLAFFIGSLSYLSSIWEEHWLMDAYNYIAGFILFVGCWIGSMIGLVSAAVIHLLGDRDNLRRS